MSGIRWPFPTIDAGHDVLVLLYAIFVRLESSGSCPPGEDWLASSQAASAGHDIVPGQKGNHDSREVIREHLPEALTSFSPGVQRRQPLASGSSSDSLPLRPATGWLRDVN